MDSKWAFQRHRCSVALPKGILLPAACVQLIILSYLFFNPQGVRNSLVSVSTLRCDTIRCGPTKDARDEPKRHLQKNVAPQAPAAIQMSLSMTGRREHV